MEKTRRVAAICGNTYQDGSIAALADFFSLLEAKGFQLKIESRFASYLFSKGIDMAGRVYCVDFPLDAEALVSFGGDGTFLHAARWAGASGVPVLGVNTGHLGFLASFSLDRTDDLLEVLVDCRAIVERRSLLKVESRHLPPDIWPYALNEIALQKEETSSMISVHSEIDGCFLADYLADGLIVSTPTGSTAYNLSAGGPIVQPTLDCMVLSPIAPHTLTMRPLVVGGDSVLRLTASSRETDFRLSLDGRSFLMKCGTVMKISKAGFEICVLRRPEDEFPTLLRDKLLWGRR